MSSTSMAESNKRRVIRIQDHLLHPALRIFRLVTANGVACTARTYDASSLGLGLVIPQDSGPIPIGETLTVHAHDKSFKLQAKVIFASLKPERRIGIQFHEKDNQVYQKLLSITQSRDPLPPEKPSQM